MLVCRSIEPLTQDIRDKIALFADVDVEAVISAIDVPDVYLVPKALQEQGLDRLVCERLGLDSPTADLGEWDELVERLDERARERSRSPSSASTSSFTTPTSRSTRRSSTPGSRTAARSTFAGSTPRT